ncbi:thioredoxin family protein [Maricaulis sp.]|uniref:thioredoxin family protein n=1 Tax=Maricaulis sp. TaxID=1486257 RepID=UPI0026223881|nr:thioredoxin family protein [Maricaulis sp.]
MRLAAVLGLFLLLAPAVTAEDDHPRPFDGNYGAMDAVDAALEDARETDRRLLLVLGANWCHDSRALAHHFQDAQLAATLEAYFVTRFIDVGWRDRNQAVTARFGVPAVYATPTVFVIDPHSERLLNRDARNDWTSAASKPVEEARDWFGHWGTAMPPAGGVLESSLIYQAMQVEIEIFEEEEAQRLAAAYRDIARWRGLPAGERPEGFAALEREVEDWRRALPRQIARLRSEARRLVAGALGEMAGDAPVTVQTVAAFDAQDPDLALDLAPHDSETW